jgi:hypothetical protein
MQWSHPFEFLQNANDAAAERRAGWECYADHRYGVVGPSKVVYRARFAPASGIQAGR